MEPVPDQPVFPEPIEIIKSGVSAEEVGRYYLRSEFSRLVTKPEALDQLMGKIEKLPEGHTDSAVEHSFWDLLSGISQTYRHNGVFNIVSDERFIWRLERIAIGDLRLTGMGTGSEMTKYIEKIENNPLKLRESLADFFAGNKVGYPKDFEKFRPSEQKLKGGLETILIFERDQQLPVFDGMNRLIQQIANGADSVVVYRGVTQKGEGKHRVGEAPFILLRDLYRTTQDESTQKAIIKTAKALEKFGSDGEVAYERRFKKVTDDPDSPS